MMKHSETLLTGKKLLHFSLIVAAVLYFGACGSSSEPAVLEETATGTGQGVGLATQTGMEGVVEGTGVVAATVVEPDGTGDNGNVDDESKVERGKFYRAEAPVYKSLFMPGDVGGMGWELCRYDLIDGGLPSYVNIRPAAASSRPMWLTEVNGVVYFAADDGTNGRELWRYDGSEAKIRNINTSTGGNSNPRFITEINGVLYFSALENVNEDRDLYYYDIAKNKHGYVRNHIGKTLTPYDPAAATTLAGVGSDPQDIKAQDGVLYFSADDGTGTIGRELYRYDPVDDAILGPQLIADIRVGSGGSNPRFMAEMNGKIYFSADDGVVGRELWVYDSSTNVSSLVRDIDPGGGNSNPRFLMDFNGVLYFEADNGVDGNELWKHDTTIFGTPTTMLTDIDNSGNSDPWWMTEMNGILYFEAGDGTGTSWELYSYDPSGDLVTLVDNIWQGAGNGSDPFWITEANGMLYFGAQDANGRELWKSDGVNPSLMTGNFGPGTADFLPNYGGYNFPYSEMIKTTW